MKDIKRRLGKVEDGAERYVEKAADRDEQTTEVDPVTALVSKLRPGSLARILREIDGKTRGLPCERE